MEILSREAPFSSRAGERRSHRACSHQPDRCFPDTSLHEWLARCLDYRDEEGQGPRSPGAESRGGGGVAVSSPVAGEELARRGRWDFHGQFLALPASSLFAVTPKMLFHFKNKKQNNSNFPKVITCPALFQNGALCVCDNFGSVFSVTSLRLFFPWGQIKTHIRIL